jgi:hypothetical protein
MHIPALEGFGLEIVEQVAIPIKQGIGNREQGIEKQGIGISS